MGSQEPDDPGENRVFEGIQDWKFLKTSRFMLLKRYPSQPGAGVDLLAVDFKYRRSILTIGNVMSAAPNEDETLVALARVPGNIMACNCSTPRNRL